MSYFYVMRAYASQGVADLVAVPPANKKNDIRALLIQAKNTKKGDYIEPLERDRMSYLDSYTGGDVVLAYKRGKIPRFKIWSTGQDMSPGDFLRDRYGILGADWNTVLQNLRKYKRPLHLHPPPVDEKGRVISSVADLYAVDIWSPHNPFLYKIKGKKG